ncbi:hypothetical protein DC31_08545 [Microbacterium sp. CH12i]|uniref:hypothetical protein n=1 Tax=Microbacterium sp. CH12i TaxID=1479651 RepID=UPI000461A95A|nr:hypothetical protein [Microbacterium sp. CH12i]KDA06671.1 hypothetical protein DC31_08545 [Microbacterium sp. CH12i]
MRTLSRQSLVATAVLTASLLGISMPAQASENDAPPPPSPEVIAAEIAAIDSPEARAAAEQLYAQAIDDGREVLGVAGGSYVAEEGDVAARSLPSDCGMSVLASRSGTVIYNDTLTSCSGSFSSLTHHLGITGENPYNPFDQRNVQNRYFYWYNRTSAANSVQYTCANTNLTNWWTLGEGTLVRNGTTYYSPAVYDTVSVVYCGW